MSIPRGWLPAASEPARRVSWGLAVAFGVASVASPILLALFDIIKCASGIR